MSIYVGRFGSMIPWRLVATRAVWPSTDSRSCSRLSALSLRLRRWRATWTASTTRTIPAPSSYLPARPSTSWCRPLVTRQRAGRDQGDGGGSAWWREGRGTTSGTTSVTSSNHDDDDVDDAFIFIFFVCALRFVTSWSLRPHRLSQVAGN